MEQIGRAITPTSQSLRVYQRIHVVAAVIENQQGQILIAKRPNNTHQGGLWEFPGGKVEFGESPQQALQRELFEELGIHIQLYAPLIQISHDYPDKSIFLNVWRVNKYEGKAFGKEGQETQWVDKKNLTLFQFPSANKPIITATALPAHYLITPEPIFEQRKDFLKNIENKLKNGTRLIQLRAKALDPQQLQVLHTEIQEINQPYLASLLINSSVEFAQKINATGVHLSASELMKTTKRPNINLCSASCHSKDEIDIANQLSLDFIVLSPVLKTTSHPEKTPLGWKNFAILCKSSKIPVYALGSMKLEHHNKAIGFGAQGIAAISSLW